MTLIFFIILSFFPTPLFPTSIGLITNKHFRGEREFAERIGLACKNLNWNVQIEDIESFRGFDQPCDWILTLVPHKSCTSNNEYLVLFDPIHHFFQKDGQLDPKYFNFAGYLTTYEDRLFLNGVYPKRWYPTVHFVPYKKVKPDRLFYFLGHWGNRHDDAKYKTLQQKLGEKDYTNFFGSLDIGKNYLSAYRGAIKYDGETVLNKISEMGICLILHSNVHIQHKIPSGRIFEAAAASAVIISDLNPFVREHFGDSVLYIDQEADDIFEQIDAHMNWILEHPKEALEMARRSHEIFEKNFLLENQLLHFNAFHRAKN